MKHVIAALLATALALNTWAKTADDIIKETGLKGGLVVVIGLDDPGLLAGIARKGPFVVQGLDTDAAKVAKAREAILAKGLYGNVSANLFDGQKLPYVDNLVNGIVSGAGCRVSGAEIERVLVPRGVALVGGEKTTKAVADELDDWTHFLYDASGNAISHDGLAGPPGGLQWTAGSLWGRSHEFNNSLVAMVTDAGRLFYIFDFGLTGMEDDRLPERWTIVARDAFNGSLLWKRHMPSWGTKQWGSKALRIQGGQLGRRLTVDGDRLYCTVDYVGDVHVLDATTGETLSTIPGTAETIEILVKGKHVVCASSTQLVCYDKTAGKVAWSRPDTRVVGQMTCANDSEVIYHDRKELICLNMGDGKVRWTYQPPIPAQKKQPATKKSKKTKPGQPQMVLIAGDKVVLAEGANLHALLLSDGKPLWKAKRPGGQSMRNYDVFYAQGKIWVSGPGSIVGFDINTGEMAKDVNVSEVQSGGHHLRCYRAKGTDRHLITQYRGVEYLSITGDSHNQNDWMRGACTYGVMPANGFLYKPMHSCFCYAGAMLKGFNALRSRSASGADLAESAAIGPVEIGPAFGDKAQGKAGGKGTWPMYRANVRRMGSSGQGVPSDLKRSWKVDLKTKVTPPVAADGRVYVAAKDQHTVYALDAKSGATRWTFTAGARIDSSPSLHKGSVLFGCADGYLYNLRAEDGALAWCRRLAPAERWVMVHGQPESVWRLHGSVAVMNGLAYCSAGRSTFLDGGLLLYAVDIATGEVKHQTRLHTLSDTRVDDVGDEFVPAYHIEGGNSDIIVAEGGYIYMNQMRFSPELKELPSNYLKKEEITARESISLDNKDYVNEDIWKVRWKNTTYDTFEKMTDIVVKESTSVGERDMGMHMFTTSGFLDDTFFNRTYWAYSKTWTGFNHTIFAPKSGQLVVVGDKLTYALKAYTSRYPLSPSLDPETKGYLLIADRNENDPTMHPNAWGRDKGMGFSRGAPPVWHHWLPVRVQAMVLAGDTIYVCGPPDKLKDGDPMASFEGRMGSELWALDAKTGKILEKRTLTEAPAFDGLIAAEGRLLMSTRDGSVICMGKK